MKERTTIPIEKKTRKRLAACLTKDKTYDEAINEMIDLYKKEKRKIYHKKN